MKPEEKVKLLEKSISELRQTYHDLDNAYNRVKTTTITFIGGSLAFLSYLYGFPTGNAIDSDKVSNLFIPQETYGIIFYFLGLGFLILALCLLFLARRPVQWLAPIERKKHKQMQFKNYQEFLEYTKDLYVDAIDSNLCHYESKQRYVNLATLFLVIGAIVLLVIKNFS